MAVQAGHMFLTADSMTTQNGRGFRPVLERVGIEGS
jgi:hypothetical protein